VFISFTKACEQQKELKCYSYSSGCANDEGIPDDYVLISPVWTGLSTEMSLHQMQRRVEEKMASLKKGQKKSCQVS